MNQVATDILKKSLESRRNFKGVLSLTLNNSAGQAAATYSINDALGACGSARTNDGTVSTNYLGGLAGLRKKLAVHTLVVNGFNYIVSENATQYNNAFKVVTGGLGNEKNESDISSVIASGRRPSNQDDKCRIIDFQTTLHAENDWLITVAAGETVILLVNIEDSTQLL